MESRDRSRPGIDAPDTMSDVGDAEIADTGLMLVYVGGASGRVLHKGDGKEAGGFRGISRGYHFVTGKVEELPLDPADEEFFRTYPGDEFKVTRAGE